MASGLSPSSFFVGPSQRWKSGRARSASNQHWNPCCKAFASRLGLEDDADLLDECLSNTYDGDERMTEIATGEVNPAAV